MPISRVKLRKPTITNTDLTAEKALGFAYQDDFEIEIERNQPSKEYLNTLIHEMLHCFLPDLSETAITRLANMLSDEIWKRKYRRIAK